MERRGRQEISSVCPPQGRLTDGFRRSLGIMEIPEGEVIESCTILTTSSNRLIAPLHDRMPVILHSQEYDLWLDRETNDPEKLKSFYQPYPADNMEMYPVSPQVNSPKVDSSELIKPYEAREDSYE